MNNNVNFNELTNTEMTEVNGGSASVVIGVITLAITAYGALRTYVNSRGYNDGYNS